MTSKEQIIANIKKNRQLLLQQAQSVYDTQRSSLLNAIAQRNAQTQVQRSTMPQVQRNINSGVSLSEQNTQATTQETEQGEAMNPIKGAGYLVERLLAGVGGGIEGTYDFLVGGAAQLLGNKEFAEELHKDDITGRYQQNIKERYNPRKGIEFVGGIGEAVGGMLPAIGLGAVTGGAGAAVSLGAMGTQAAGRGTTQAYQETGELGLKENIYGAASGLLEGAVETLAPGVGGILGKGVAKTATKGLFNKIGGKVIKNTLIRSMIGEGLEEVASTGLDPVLKRLTYNPDAESATFNDYLQSFVLGAAASGILQGGQTLVAKNPQARKLGSAITAKNETQLVIDEGLKLAGTESERKAKAIQSRIRENKEVTTLAVGRLAMQVQADSNDVEVNKLVESGMSKAKAEKTVQEAYVETIKQDRFDYQSYVGNDTAQQDALRQGFESEAITTKDLEKISKIRKRFGITNMEFYHDPHGENGMNVGGKIRINTAKSNVFLQTGIHEYVHNIELNDKKAFDGFKQAAMALTAIPKYKADADRIRARYASDERTMGMSAEVIDGEVAINLAMDLISDKTKMDAFLKDVGVEKQSVIEKLARFFKGLYERLKGTPEAKQVGQAYNALVKALKDGKAKETTDKQAAKEMRYALANTEIGKLKKGNDYSDLLPNNTDKEFAKAVNHFSYPTKVYRGMEAEEFDSIYNNGFIKSKGDYNFSYQTGRTSFTGEATTALSYATSFAPSQIRDKFYRQGLPAYIVEVNNAPELDMYMGGNAKIDSYESPIKEFLGNGELFSEKEISASYISKIYELTYDEATDNVDVSEIDLPKEFNTKGETDIYKPSLYKDKTTGTILMAIKNRQGKEYGYYISSADTSMLVNYEKYNEDYRNRAAKISGNKSDLIKLDTDIRYSLDSNSKTLSPAQQEFFKDSKVRDEQGRLLEVYHGTPYGGFNTFNGRAYFASNKKYADVYQDIWASALRGQTREDATNRQTYSVYLNIKKPFDTRNPKDMVVWDKFYTGEREYGIREKGLPDWKAGEDLYKYLSDNSYDYDGIILDEFGILKSGQERGLSYTTFSPSQIKLTTNLNPTESEDIRYSLTLEQARQTNTKLNLPKSQEFINAVKNTKTAQITDEGLIIDVVRKQNPEQSGELALRKGVFYLVSGDKRISYYGGKTGYGGSELYTGKTLFKNPLFVKGATGGKAPEAAFAQLRGKTAIEELDKKIFAGMGFIGMNRISRQDKINNLAELMTEYGVDYNYAFDDAYNIVENSNVGNTLRYAAREYIMGEVARQEGYDSIIGYSKERSGNEFISEIFDLREKTYPSKEFESDVNEEYLSKETRYSLSDKKPK